MCSMCVNARYHCRLRPPFQRTPVNILYRQKLETLLDICIADSMGISLFVCVKLSSKATVFQAQHTDVKQNVT